VGAQSSGLGKTASDSVQNPAAPRSENLLNNPAKGAIHSAPISGSVTTETTWQKGNESGAASANPPLSSSASTVTPQQFDAHSQPAAPAPTLQKDAAPEATSIQSKGAVSASSGGSAAHANLSDSSTSGQGKSGQQSGPGSGNDPAGVATFAPIHTNSPAPDPAGNLLTGHAPSVPASHTTTSAPQTAPSSTQPASTLAAWQNYDGGAGKIVRSASISDSANGAEMHVELRSGALGPLEIHTVVREGSVGAEIHVQGQEAHTLLAAGLPSLERALGDRNLRVENITVYQDQAGGGMSGGTKQDSQSGSSPSPHPQALPWNDPPQSSSAVSGSSEDEELANPAAGLSVRA
jgi:flagellar hook-length control protein FliK